MQGLGKVPVVPDDQGPDELQHIVILILAGDGRSDRLRGAFHRDAKQAAMWVALGIVAHCAMWLAMHDEEILIRLVASALVYLGLLKFSPHAARVWLCAVGALAGAFLEPQHFPC